MCSLFTQNLGCVLYMSASYTRDSTVLSQHKISISLRILQFLVADGDSYCQNHKYEDETTSTVRHV